MGYGKFDQTATGIHQRQFCRAFVVADSGKRIAFVSADAGMMSQLVKMEVKCACISVQDARHPCCSF